MHPPRAVAFDPDRVCQALFAATDALGHPDALRARELGHSAAHFLAQEYEGQTPTPAEVDEVVIKVLRQLGHADLARAYEGRPAATALPSPYSADLADAAARGLLRLDDPDRLAALTALDGLDHRALAEARTAADVAREVRDAARDAVINLNCATPPTHDAPLVHGPLFAGPPPFSAERRGAMAEALLQELPASEALWHLGESDFTGPGRDRLARLAHRPRLAFAFDRPRRPVALAAGLDRDHPAALLVAGLGLPALAEQPGLLADPAKFLHRLGSLARLALSAGVQKRARLRQRLGDAVTRGFLLDRARLVAVPVGLDEVVRRFTGWGLANGGEALELGLAITRRLREALHSGGRALGLTACLDVQCRLTEHDPDRAATAQSQLRAAGALHAGEAGEAIIFAPPTEAVAVLEQAWRQGDIARVRLLAVRDTPGA